MLRINKNNPALYNLKKEDDVVEIPDEDIDAEDSRRVVSSRLAKKRTVINSPGVRKYETKAYKRDWKIVDKWKYYFIASGIIILLGIVLLCIPKIGVLTSALTLRAAIQWRSNTAGLN